MEPRGPGAAVLFVDTQYPRGPGGPLPLGVGRGVSAVIGLADLVGEVTGEGVDGARFSRKELAKMGL